MIDCVNSQQLDFHPETYEGLHLEPAEALSRSRAFLDLMRQRRSIRDFAPNPVPAELIENAIRVAGSAPSGANQQPWTFVVVTDPDTKEQIRQAAEQEEELLYRERAGAEYLQAIRPIGTNANKPHITDAPYLIAVFEQAWRLDEDGKHKHYYVRESVGIAVGFLLAALHASGLVTLTHAPSPMRFLKEILERPDNERPFLLIPVGYPAPGAQIPTLTKKTLDEIAIHV
jgi:iodotyrosine deiodinase